MPTTITGIPTRNVVSVVHFMRQELSMHFPISEIESLINYSFKQILGYGRMEMIMQAEREVPIEKMLEFSDVIAGLKLQVPIQYIFGRCRFYGLELLLTDDVLIPRPETEELVHWVISDFKNSVGMRVLDIGTGSGCIAVSLKSGLADSQVDAIDVSADALVVARQNSTRNKTDVSFYEFDILSDIPFGMARYDVIVSNPPYVTHAQKKQMQPNVLNYEPHIALFVSDEDPLLFYRSIASFCQRHLNPGGTLYLEINEDFGQATVDLLQAFNFTGIQLKKDLNGKFRMVKATR
jgi:release factor glutamine methyltransferase